MCEQIPHTHILQAHLPCSSRLQTGQRALPPCRLDQGEIAGLQAPLKAEGVGPEQQDLHSTITPGSLPLPSAHFEIHLRRLHLAGQGRAQWNLHFKFSRWLSCAASAETTG